jgi:hypothetical protein
MEQAFQIIGSDGAKAAMLAIARSRASERAHFLLRRIVFVPSLQ